MWDSWAARSRSDALEVGEDSAFPLQAALGYDLTQNLFIGERNLLVEGPSDLVYLARQPPTTRPGPRGPRRALAHLAGRRLVERACFRLAARQEGVGYSVARLRHGGQRQGRGGHQANKTDSGRVVFVSSVLEQNHADIEDLVAVEDYLELYNEAFGKSIEADGLSNHHERILKRLENTGQGKFDDWKPAEILLRDPSKVEALSDATLANFEALAKRINATHA